MEKRGEVMSYPYLLLICILLMGSIALVMYYLGTKISYNYILYNASISIGSGVIFFLFKIILTSNQNGPIEQTLDIIITMLLFTVWLVTLVETFTVEVMENGRELKRNIFSLLNRIKTIDYKSLPAQIIKSVNLASLKTKKYFVKNKLTLRIQKIIVEISKYKELNKRV